MSNNSSSREQFASRVGFILMTAGCAIGLGNVWRFSYISGQYGGGFFVLLYLIFLLLLGTPVMLMELALGRAGQSTFPGAFRRLKKPDCRYAWEKPVYIFFSGNLILLMFYSVITGWLLHYGWLFCKDTFRNATPETCKNVFAAMLDAPATQIFWMLAALLITLAICIGGVRKSIERAIKFMMGGLFLLMIILVIQSLNLPDSGKGLEFFLKPDWKKFAGNGIFATVHAAMAQAFFTLSLGVGSIAVCGSYTSKESSLLTEGCWIVLLDTIVAIASGLIIFPACAAFGIQPDAGPSLIFITLPNVFHNMAGGIFWGILFFIFLAIAALSTLVAVFENLAAFGMDQWSWSRKKSCLIFAALLAVLSLPCILGFNLWKNIQPLGNGSTILDLEDFIISDNLLPLGALYTAIFCMNRYGWGKENAFAEINTGKGLKFPLKTACYLTYILPLIIFAIWLLGLGKRFNWF